MGVCLGHFTSSCAQSSYRLASNKRPNTQSTPRYLVPAAPARATRPRPGRPHRRAERARAATGGRRVQRITTKRLSAPAALICQPVTRATRQPRSGSHQAGARQQGRRSAAPTQASCINGAAPHHSHHACAPSQPTAARPPAPCTSIHRHRRAASPAWQTCQPVKQRRRRSGEPPVGSRAGEQQRMPVPTCRLSRLARVCAQTLAWHHCGQACARGCAAGCAGAAEGGAQDRARAGWRSRQPRDGRQAGQHAARALRHAARLVGQAVLGAQRGHGRRDRAQPVPRQRREQVVLHLEVQPACARGGRRGWAGGAVRARACGRRGRALARRARTAAASTHRCRGGARITVSLWAVPEAAEHARVSRAACRGCHQGRRPHLPLHPRRPPRARCRALSEQPGRTAAHR